MFVNSRLVCFELMPRVISPLSLSFPISLSRCIDACRLEEDMQERAAYLQLLGMSPAQLVVHWVHYVLQRSPALKVASASDDQNTAISGSTAAATAGAGAGTLSASLVSSSTSDTLKDNGGTTNATANQRKNTAGGKEPSGRPVFRDLGDSLRDGSVYVSLLQSMESIACFVLSRL